MYIGPDKHDAQFTIEGLVSDIQTRVSSARLRRLEPYFCGMSDLGVCFAYQNDRQCVTVWVDGDWSGNAKAFKSTSSGATQIGEHTVEAWSVNQKAMSLSSAESESEF